MCSTNDTIHTYIITDYKSNRNVYIHQSSLSNNYDIMIIVTRTDSIVRNRSSENKCIQITLSIAKFIIRVLWNFTCCERCRRAEPISICLGAFRLPKFTTTINPILMIIIRIIFEVIEY